MRVMVSRRELQDDAVRAALVVVVVLSLYFARLAWGTEEPCPCCGDEVTALMPLPTPTPAMWRQLPRLNGHEQMIHELVPPTPEVGA